MTEKEIKSLLKLAVENSNKQLTIQQKEHLKLEIDNAKTYDDIMAMISNFLLM